MRGLFEVVRMTQHGAVELRKQEKSSTLIVHCQGVKHCVGKDVDRELKTLTLVDE